MTESTSSVSVQTTPVTDEAEMAVLGAVLLSGTVALPAIMEEGVQPEDFRLPKRETIFTAMCAMHNKGDSIDRLTLADFLLTWGCLESLGGREEIDLLACSVPNVGNLRQYARIVVRQSMWRQRTRHLLEVGEAVLTQDEDAYRRVLGKMRECELRFRPLLERDLSTP